MKSIKYIGFDDTTGYGIAAKNLVSSLRQAGATVHWTPVVAGASAYDPCSVPQVREGYENVIIHTVPEYYPAWLKFERNGRKNAGTIWGHTTWETDKIPSHWLDLLNSLDGILVPCAWNRDVFMKCGVITRIEVLPHISQFQGRPPETLPSPGIKKLKERIGERYVFYSVGVWSERKAPQLLIKAFLSEFGSDERVVLIIKTGKHDFENYRRKWNRPWVFTLGKAADAFKKVVKSGKNGPEVIHLDEEMSDDDIAWLHQTGDCFVSLGRGEGWGMGVHEAAWWGKPIITTGIGGVLDYLPDSLSYHVNYDLAPVRCSAYSSSYTSDQLWAEPDLSHARKLMRQVFEDPKAAAEKGIQLKAYIDRHFQSSLTAKRCLDLLLHE